MMKIDLPLDGVWLEVSIGHIMDEMRRDVYKYINGNHPNSWHISVSGTVQALANIKGAKLKNLVD
jgi:hypothetical protein